MSAPYPIPSSNFTVIYSSSMSTTSSSTAAFTIEHFIQCLEDTIIWQNNGFSEKVCDQLKTFIAYCKKYKEQYTYVDDLIHEMPHEIMNQIVVILRNRCDDALYSDVQKIEINNLVNDIYNNFMEQEHQQWDHYDDDNSMQFNMEFNHEENSSLTTVV